MQRLSKKEVVFPSGCLLFVVPEWVVKVELTGKDEKVNRVQWT